MPNVASKLNYECPRCGYYTDQRSNIKHHLYKRLKPCRVVLRNIELTAEIKQFIIDNCVYSDEKFKQEEPTAVAAAAVAAPIVTLNQTINYINTTNNFVANLSFQDKLNQYINHTEKEIVPIDEFMSIVFKSKIDRLERLPPSFVLNSTDFLSIVSTASSPKTVDKINIMYDSVTTNIHIFRNHKWEQYIEEKGLTEIMQCIQEVMYDVYECYLIRKLHALDDEGRVVLRLPFEELLCEYYRFIAIFDLEPYIKDKTNQDILEDESDDDESNTICDKYYSKYVQAQNTVTIRVCKETKKRVLDIVKRNFKASLEMLNKEVANLFRMDEEFKAKLSQTIIRI